MRLSTASTLLAATVVSGATLQARHHCFDFDSVCGPWTLTLDGSSWSLGIDCRNNNGANVHSKINMNECLGNAGGKLVSGGNAGYTCKYRSVSDVPNHPDISKLRNPIAAACEDGKGGETVTYIELHDIMCDIDGTIRCQNQYDQHMYGL